MSLLVRKLFWWCWQSWDVGGSISMSPTFVSVINENDCCDVGDFKLVTILNWGDRGYWYRELKLRDSKCWRRLNWCWWQIFETVYITDFVLTKSLWWFCKQYLKNVIIPSMFLFTHTQTPLYWPYYQMLLKQKFHASLPIARMLRIIPGVDYQRSRNTMGEQIMKTHA